MGSMPDIADNRERLSAFEHIFVGIHNLLKNKGGALSQRLT